jgi:hypothetical protein
MGREKGKGKREKGKGKGKGKDGANLPIQLALDLVLIETVWVTVVAELGLALGQRHPRRQGIGAAPRHLCRP